MPYRKWDQVESKYKKPMADVLTDLYKKHGSTKNVAAELGVTSKAVWEWRRKACCETEVVIRVKCDEASR